MRALKSTFIVVIALFTLGGCTMPQSRRHNSDKPKVTETGEILHDLARAYLIGTTHDKALIAARQGSSRKLFRLLDQMDWLGANDVSSQLQLQRAEDLVREAMIADMRAHQTRYTNMPVSREKFADAIQKYRSAIRWSPDFPSQNPLLLNALGYFLADQGSSTDDFELSIKLTARALEILDTISKENSGNGTSARVQRRQLQQQMALTRDSLAWGLFKLQRYEDADTAQQKALDEAHESQLNDKSALAELWWHQAKIWEAQDMQDDAQEALDHAQRLQPEDPRYSE